VDVLESATSGLKKGVKSALKQASATTVRLLGSGSELYNIIDVDEEAICDDVDDDHEESINRTEEQVVEMLGGYCITRLFRQQKLKCSECKELLLKTQRNILLQEREYRECTSQALFSSSLSLHRFLMSAECEIRRVLKKDLHKDGIGRHLKETILRKNVSVLNCCHPIDAAEAVIGLYLRVRLHHQSKLTNAFFNCRKKQKKQEKLKKFIKQ